MVVSNVEEEMWREYVENVHVDWNAAMVMKKAEPYHETSSRLLNSVVILGMAVATIV